MLLGPEKEDWIREGNDSRLHSKIPMKSILLYTTGFMVSLGTLPFYQRNYWVAMDIQSSRNLG